jgi:hypothetical protein
MNRSRLFMMMFGGLFFVLSLHHLSWLIWQRPDVWWTPQPMSVPVAEAGERVEVYVRDAPIQQETQAGRLQWLTQTGVTPLGPADVRLRFNNWDRIRVAKMPILLAAAACAGASGVVLLLGILGWIPSKSRSLDRHAPT